jgi:hypothetical protein
MWREVRIFMALEGRISVQGLTQRVGRNEESGIVARHYLTGNDVQRDANAAIMNVSRSLNNKH